MPDDVPLVTITDPSRPDRAPQVIGPSRELPPPRRIPRTQLAVGLVLGLALLAGTGTVASARHRADERLLDRAATAAVHLALVDSTNYDQVPDGQVRIALRNDSGAPVRVLRARVDAPGYAWQRLALPLDRDAQGDLVLATTPVCRPELAEEGPRRLLVDVETQRRTRATVPVPLLDGVAVASPIAQAAQRQCGTLPLRQSLEVVFAPAVLRGRAVLVDLAVYNAGVLPLTVVGVKAGGRGFHLDVQLPLPLALPPRPDLQALDSGSSRALQVVLRPDCAASPRRTTDDDGVLLVTVARGTATADVTLGVDGLAAAERKALAACR